MKVKAVFFRQDRTNDVIKLSHRKIAQGKTFSFDKETYELHSDRFQVTTERPNWGLGLKVNHYATYYYIKGHAKPLPVPDFKMLMVESQVASLKAKLIAHQKGTGPEPKPEDYEITVDTSDGLRAVVDNGISAEEMESVFNPWFYRVISPHDLTPREKMILLGVIITVCLGAYLVYMLATGNFKLPPVGA